MPSSDHSYHGDLDAFTAWFRKAQRPWLAISLPDLFGLSCFAQPDCSRQPEPLCTGGAVLACSKHPEPSPAWLHLWLATCFKLLSEPSATSDAQQRRLHTLRDAADRLGELWRYHASTTRLHAGLPEADALSSDEDQDALCRRASFIICVPGYNLETVVVEVQFPTVLQDVLPLVQAARARDRALRLPHLLPVAPQPTDGTGVLVAAPHWQAGALVICVDATRLDGRLFAAIAPAYVDGVTLEDLAGVRGCDVLIYAGLDQTPLPPGTLAHLAAGTTVTVVPVTAPPSLLWDLGQLLLDAGQWSAHSLITEPEIPDAYCLVSERRCQLFRADLSRPLQHRQRLAEAIGAGGASVTVIPARPRVADIALAGVPCRTAVAVLASRPSAATGPLQVVIVDCRPIQEDWFVWQAPAGLLLLPDLRRFLRQTAPLGHDVHIAGAPDGIHMQVQSGDVLTVDYVLRPPSVTRFPGHTAERAAAALPGGGHRLHPSGQDSPAGPPAPDPAAHGVPATTAAAGPPTATDASSGTSTGPRRAVFLVFAPGYLPELLEVVLWPPVSVLPRSLLQARLVHGML